MWMVRAGSHGALFAEFEARKLVAVGFSLSAECADMSYPQLIEYMRRTYGGDVPGRIVQFAATSHRFMQEIQVGDPVTTYDPRGREYLIGRITSQASFAPDQLEGMRFIRSVEWTSRKKREELSTPARLALGPTTAVFRVADHAAAELEVAGEHHAAEELPQSTELTSEVDTIETARSEALELIKDRVARMAWDEVQNLVAGLLRAMGYKTRVSPAGPDRGRDILASPDGLGFQSPRIIVEVKHRNVRMGAPEIRSFLGACSHAEDRGLYVSTGGFTKEAYYEAERAKTPITLMDIDDLVDALIENYEGMDIEARTLLPLVKVYWPAPTQF